MKQLFTFQGRLSRLGYWRTVLLLQVVLGVVWCAGLFAILAVGKIGAVLFLGFAPVVVGMIAAGLRRLHDRDKGAAWLIAFAFGPWTLLALAQPLLHGARSFAWGGAILTLVALGLSIWGWIEIGFRRGMIGPNRYGP